MTQNKTQLRRLLLLETFLAIVGIILSSSFYLYAIGQQQRIAENLFQHPFSISNAALEFRSDVLELRKYMLEAMFTHKQTGEIQLAKIHKLEDHMDSHLTIIRRDFLGDQVRVSNIMLELDAWKMFRESVKNQILMGNNDDALSLAMQQASPHIEQILVDTDNVISFARSRALRFVGEGQAQMTKARLFLVVLVILSLSIYLLLTNKLRQEIYKIYDIEEYNATFDELCGSHNRKSFIKLSEAEIRRSRRHDLPLSLLMMDLDHFKNVNDSHGHDVGDTVLNQFSIICSKHLRAADFLGRIGGEEFAILLPHTDLNGALNIAERIRQEAADWNYKIADAKNLKVTVSIGVASLDGGITSTDTLLKRADEAMYRSKRGGRNQVTAGPAVKSDCLSLAH